MKLRDFIENANAIPPKEHIYLLQNPYFWRRAGWDVLTHGNILNSDTVLFLGYRDEGLENKIDRLSNLRFILDKIEKMENNYVIILGKHYFTVDRSFLNYCPKNVRFVASPNVDVSDMRATYFPLGRDFRSREVSRKYTPKPGHKRTQTCYANFSTDTHFSRIDLERIAKKLGHVRCDHMGQFLNYPISRDKFFERLRDSRFALCPRGVGIETYRMWDCLYLGVVPIVVCEAVFHNELTDLPILFIDSWETFERWSATDLNDRFDHMINQHYDFDKLRISTWFRQIYDRYIGCAALAV